MTKTKQVTLKATQTRGEPITQNVHFAMIELAALEGLHGLMKSSPKAAELIVCLVRRMSPGSGGVVLASRETMRELLNCSMPTVDRALKVLIDGGWVQRIKVGGAHALAINSRVAWIGPRGELQHAVFGATVIASRSEQDAIALNPPPMRELPILQPGEMAVSVGEGSPPPSQRLLGVEPPVVVFDEQGQKWDVDRTTGELQARIKA
jgi:hypothetical protein